MNRVRTFKPELFELLEIPQTELCDRQLSGLVMEYIKKRRIYESDGCSEIITLTPPMKELTGFPFDSITLTKHYRKHLDWWELISIISRRWKA
jgi:hypothetical protein